MTLELAGGVTVRADREAVWAALHDPDRLRLCVPGCRKLERRSESWFEVAVLMPLGPVAVVFDGSIEVIESAFPQMLALRGRGQGGVAGLAVGCLRIDLTESPSGCRLAYVLVAAPSGPVAALGTMLLLRLARGQVERFVRTFAAIVGAPTFVASRERPSTASAPPGSSRLLPTCSASDHIGMAKTYGSRSDSR